MLQAVEEDDWKENSEDIAITVIEIHRNCDVLPIVAGFEKFDIILADEAKLLREIVSDAFGPNWDCRKAKTFSEKSFQTLSDRI